MGSTSFPRSPVPILATWNPAISQYAVEFNRELFSQPIDSLNWSVRRNNTRWSISAAQILVGKAVLTQGSGLGEPGPDVVDYSPPPFDIESLDHVAAAAFSDFPLTL